MALLLVVVVIGLLVGAVARMLRAGRHEGPGGRSGWWLRRLLQYGFLLVALFSAANGLTQVLAAAVPVGRRIAGPASSELALGLSLALVATPIWLLLWRVVSRRLRHDSAERASTAWAVAATAAATVALIVADINVVRVATWALGVEEFDGRALAAAVVWSAVWAVHTWFLRRQDLAPAGPLSDLPGLAGSMVGLVGLALGAHGMLLWGLQRVHRALAGPALVEGAATTALRQSVAVAAVAAVIWWWHWLRVAARAPATGLWHGYVLLVGVLGGVLTAIGGAAVVVHTVIQWLIGDPEATTAAVHFAGLPRAVAAAVVGDWVWRYHRAALREAGRRRRGEPDRAYEYLVAAVGLVTTASGAAIAVAAAIAALAPAPLAAADPSGRNLLALAVTLLVVGTPLWWVRWRMLQGGVATGDQAELTSPSRRGYLFVLFGVAASTAAISGVVVLFVVLRDLLEGVLAATILHELRVAIALVVVAGGVSAYHWMVVRDDRRAQPDQEERPRRHVLLVSAGGDQLAGQVAERTGATVQALHRTDTAAVDVDVDAVAAAILDSSHPRLLVMVDGDGTVRAIPYETVPARPRV